MASGFLKFFACLKLNLGFDPSFTLDKSGKSQGNCLPQFHDIAKYKILILTFVVVETVCVVEVIASEIRVLEVAAGLSFAKVKQIVIFLANPSKVK